MILKVYGPPGTGKTSFLIDVVRREIDSGVNPWEIVYCSFTRVASNVARDRVLSQFPQYKRSDFTYFNTIHSICFRLLQLNRSNVFTTSRLHDFGVKYHYRFSEQFTVDNGFNETLSDAMIQTAADCAEAFVNWYKNSYPLTDIKTAFADFCSRIHDAPNGFGYSYVLKYIADRNSYKQDNYLWDFPDMIIACLDNMLYPQHLRVLILDEAQDSFPTQFELIKLWSKKAERTYIAGDAYQAIYTFSGANPELMIGFKADESMVLKQSYRCPQAICDVASRIRNNFMYRYNDDDFMPAQNKGAIIRGKFSYIDNKHIFYLLRTRHLVDTARQFLIDNCVPFRVRRGKPNIFSSESRLRAIRTLMDLVDDKPVELCDIVNLIEYLPSRKYVKHGSKTEIRKLSDIEPEMLVWRNKLSELGFTPTFIDRLTNYDSAFESIVGQHIATTDMNYIIALINRFGYDIVRRKPNLELGTIHSVKGDECDVVVIDPTYTKLPYLNMITGGDEEHRIMYVAVTRSRDTLVILPPRSDKYYGGLF